MVRTIETGGTWLTSAVIHKNAVSQISALNLPMHRQKSIQTRLYHQGTPNSGSTGGPGVPGPIDVRMSQVHYTDQTASLETGTTRNVSQTPS